VSRHTHGVLWTLFAAVPGGFCALFLIGGLLLGSLGASLFVAFGMACIAAPLLAKAHAAFRDARESRLLDESRSASASNTLPR